MKNLSILNKSEPSIKSKQAGLSLIELLVSMFIGLFLLIGITTSYLSSKKSSMTRDQISILEDSGRIALELLTKTLQHTGYKSKELGVLENPFMNILGKPISTSCAMGGNSVVDNTFFPNENIKNEINDTGDVIGVVYLGDDTLNQDCSGGDLLLPLDCQVGAGADTAASKIFNTFFIDADDNLQCAGSRSADLTLIAEGVENIQFLYGINADNDLSKSVDRYVNADDVGNDWGLVVSVQIAILVRTLKEIKSDAESKSFSLLDQEVVSPTDRYQRAVFSATVNLRNM